MGATKNAILGGGPGFELLNSEIRNSIYGLYWGGADAVVQGNWFHTTGVMHFIFIAETVVAWVSNLSITIL